MTSDTYAALTPQTLPQRLGSIAALHSRLGDFSNGTVHEVGDGNLNLVFIVQSPAGGIVVKQALPYVRLVGESWPLPLRRSFFEYNALIRQQARDPGSVPEVFHFDEAPAIVAMEYLGEHVILRQSLMAYLAKPGHAAHSGGRASYQDWILGEVEILWQSFVAEFTHLWRTERTGMLYPATLFEDQGQVMAAEQAALTGLPRSGAMRWAFAVLKCIAAFLALPISRNSTRLVTRRSAPVLKRARLC